MIFFYVLRPPQGTRKRIKRFAIAIGLCGLTTSMPIAIFSAGCCLFSNQRLLHSGAAMPVYSARLILSRRVCDYARMSFQDKYELVDLIEDGPAKVFVARELATGRKLGVFLFVGEQARAQAELLKRLHAIDRREFPELIEVGDNEGTPYVVTLPLSSFEELKTKVGSHKSAPPPAAHKRDNFTRAGVWHVPPVILPESAHPPQPAAGKPATRATSTSPEPPQHISGEFTRMFQSSAPPMNEPEKSAPPMIAAEPPKAARPAESAAGEFTRMFRSPAAPIDEEAHKTTPPEPAEITPQPPPLPSGEFTRMFETTALPISEPAQSVLPPGPTKTRKAAPPAEPVAGEFTRMFQSPEPHRDNLRATAPPSPIEQAGPAHPQTEPAPGQFTRMFQTPAAPIGEPKQASPPAVKEPAPAAHTPEAAPGEFTKLFQATPQPPRAPSAVPDPPKAGGELTRILGSAVRAADSDTDAAACAWRVHAVLRVGDSGCSTSTSTPGRSPSSGSSAGTRHPGRIHSRFRQRRAA